MSSEETRPPFRQFVIKIHSRCNLACDHCYVYEHPDQSWRTRPVVMADSTMRAIAQRVAEHAGHHRLGHVDVVLHGGEPLLAGHRRVETIARLIRQAVPPGVAVRITVQSNGVLLDETWCDLLVAEDIAIGLSLDGDRAANDRHRRFANGRSSYADVVAAARLLGQARYRSAFVGILCTVDVRNDPIATYEALLSLAPPRIDFLLPHATWDHPPHRPEGHGTPYADWLLSIHERWQGDGQPVPIRTFDAVHELTAGGVSTVESLGLDDVDLVVIETDGAIEQVDSLKAAYDGAPATGYRVQEHTFDDAGRHPGFDARRGGRSQLCTACRTCPVVDVCGGGMYPHRYRTGTRFDNPSVYCPDLLRLVGEMRHQRAKAADAHHELPVHLFDALATGGGPPEAIEALQAAQRSLRRSWLAHAVRQPNPEGSEVHAAWDALCALDEVAPVEVDGVLAHPFLGIALDCLTDDPRAVAYLWQAAVAAAVHGRQALRAEIPVRGRQVVLPTLGALRMTPDRQAPVVLEVDGAGGLALDGRAVERDGERADRRWRRLRPMVLGDGRPCLDDLDPFRDCFRRPPTSRLDPRQFDVWKDAVRVAGERIEQDFTRHRHALRALRTITPLKRALADASTTHRSAHGAIGIATPADRSRLVDAVTDAVLHELQHVKLGAVLDLYTLVDPRDRRRFRVGWREDARPLEAVLQGAYAHLAVIQLWRDRANHAPGNAAQRTAISTLERLQRQTWEAIDLLLGSGSLTALGQRWVEQMREADGCTSSG